MDVKNHRIEDIWFKQSSNLSGTIAPTVIVTHYTTGWSGKGSRDWLLGAAGGTSNRITSAHVVIDHDGTAWQIAPFNRRAHHAGPSKYGTLRDLNSHAIGLEFANPGWMKPLGGNRWVDDNGVVKTADQLNSRGGFTEAPHPRVGSQIYGWPLFSERQLATGREIVLALIRKYAIKAIVTHEEIDTRGWKTDPGPAFPQQSFVDLLGEEQEPDEPQVLYAVNATRLNIRGGPSIDADRIDPPGSLPNDTRVAIERMSGVWAYVTVKKVPAGAQDVPLGLKGWVHSGYLDRVF